MKAAFACLVRGRVSWPAWFVWQLDQNVTAPWYVPVGVGLSTFAVTLRRASLALPLVLLATALDRYRFDFGGAGLRLEHFVFAGVVLGWFLAARPRLGELGLARADLLLLVYLAVGLVSSLLFAPSLRESLKFLALMGFGVALYAFVRVLACAPGAFERSVWLVIAAGVAASAFGILAWLVYPFGINLGVQTYALENLVTVSPYGTLFDSNTLGLYAMAAALVQITLLLHPAGTRTRRQRALLALGLSTTLIAVALSLTRVAWLGLALGLVLVVLTSPRRRLALAIGGAALALVIAALLINSVLAASPLSVVELSLSRLLTVRSLLFRLDAYTRAWNDFLASPWLGNGVNVFAQKYTSPAGARDWISNFVLMTLHDTGLVGLVVLGSWLAWLGRETWLALRRAGGPLRTLLLALAIAYLALLLTYQATTVFWLGWNWIYLGLIRAGALAVRSEQAPRLSPMGGQG